MAQQHGYKTTPASTQTHSPSAPQIILRIDYAPTGQTRTSMTAQMTQTHALRTKAQAPRADVITLANRRLH